MDELKKQSEMQVQEKLSQLSKSYAASVDSFAGKMNQRLLENIRKGHRGNCPLGTLLCLLEKNASEIRHARSMRKKMQKIKRERKEEAKLHENWVVARLHTRETKEEIAQRFERNGWEPLSDTEADLLVRFGEAMDGLRLILSKWEEKDTSYYLISWDAVSDEDDEKICLGNYLAQASTYDEAKLAMWKTLWPTGECTGSGGFLSFPDEHVEVLESLKDQPEAGILSRVFGWDKFSKEQIEEIRLRNKKRLEDAKAEIAKNQTIYDALVI